LIAVVAILALLLLDRLKPSRASRAPARARRRGQPVGDVVMMEDQTVLYRRTPIWKRVFAFSGLGVVSIVLGVLLAMAVALAMLAALTLLSGLS
jgi:hypothetical protein